MERYQEIERSIIKTYRGKLWAPFIKALKEYELLKLHDKVLILVDGTRDSVLLAKLFEELLKHSDFEFEYKILIVGREEELKSLMEEVHIQGEYVSETPVLSSTDCNKIVESASFDDMIETTMKNMLYHGKLETILPKEKIDEKTEYIRPLSLIRERDLKAWVNYNQIVFKENDTSDSEKEEVRNLIKNLEKDYNDNVAFNIYRATQNIYIDKILKYEKQGKVHTFLDNYDEGKDER